MNSKWKFQHFFDDHAEGVLIVSLSGFVNLNYIIYYQLYFHNLVKKFEQNNT